MKRLISVILFSLLGSTLCQAQLNLDQRLIGSSSLTVSSTSPDPVSFSFSLGEITTITVPGPSDTARMATLGFLQPGFLKVKKKEANDLIVYQFVSPNLDGKNETFYVKNLDNYASNELTLFDKEGHVVYRKKNYDNNWTGSDLSADNYFYILKVEGIPEELKGGFVLTR